MVKKIYLFSYIGNATQMTGVSDAVLQTAVPCEGYILILDGYVETKVMLLLDTFATAEENISPGETEVEYNPERLTGELKHLAIEAIKEQRSAYEKYFFELKEIPAQTRLKLKEKFQ